MTLYSWYMTIVHPSMINDTFRRPTIQRKHHNLCSARHRVHIATPTSTQDGSSLVDLVRSQPSANGPEATPDEALRVVCNLHVRDSVRRPNDKPGCDECCQARRIPRHKFSSHSCCSGALGDDAGDDGNGEEGHLLDVVRLGVFGALVLLEAVYLLVRNHKYAS
jgi:hypothetical protein